MHFLAGPYLSFLLGTLVEGSWHYHVLVNARLPTCMSSAVQFWGIPEIQSLRLSTDLRTPNILPWILKIKSYFWGWNYKMARSGLKYAFQLNNAGQYNINESNYTWLWFSYLQEYQLKWRTDNLYAIAILDQSRILVQFGSLWQWFSTSGSWRPSKHKNTHFGDPCLTIKVLKQRFWRPKSKCPRPKSGSRPTCWETLLYGTNIISPDGKSIIIAL